MPKGILFLIILVLLVAGGAALLSRSVNEQPTRPIEVDVTANGAAG